MISTRRHSWRIGRQWLVLATLAGSTLARVFGAEQSDNKTADLIQEIQQHSAASNTTASNFAVRREKAPNVLLAYPKLAQLGNWTELWPDGKGGIEKRDVAGTVWSAAIQASLDQAGGVFLPRQDAPYYLDRPIVLKSGQFLIADPQAEIRLKPDVNTCMLRNESVVAFHDRPIPSGLSPDTDILVEGGIWTTLLTAANETNGNRRGQADRNDSVPGAHGVLFLHNVRRVAVRNLTVRQSRPFGVHIGNAAEFLIENIHFDRHGRDGVHVQGPASFGIVRNVDGVMHDDPVALNAWDWREYAPQFGAIHHVLVEGVRGAPAAARSTDSIRLLPGVKQFSDGSRLPCPVHDIVLRDIVDIREFKLYDQPNLESGRNRDYSAEIGDLRNIHIQGVRLTRPGTIKIAANADGIFIDDVDLNFPLAPDFRLVEIGPMSATYKPKPNDPNSWVEIFSPDRDVIVRQLRLGIVRHQGQAVSDADQRFVSVRDQTLNPSYPKTTPRGGTGKAKRFP